MKAFLEEIKDIPVGSLIYIDETGIDKYLHREHGYAPKGEALVEAIPGRKYARTSIVAGQRGSEVLAPMTYDGTMDSAFFEAWFEFQAIPASRPGDVFVLDNASVHRKNALQEICGRHGRRVIFLPPYSPELNPIEKLWAKIKKLLRSIMYLHDTLEDAICSVFQSI